MSADPSPIDVIRSQLSIHWVWEHLQLPGRPGKNCKSPFRQEKKASFTIYKVVDGSDRFWDHVTGEGGDVTDFWCKARDCDIKTAIAELQEFLRGASRPLETSVRPQEKRAGILWPPTIRDATAADCRALGKLRGLRADPFWLGHTLGTLRVAEMYGQPSWVLTDCAGICGEGRRMDGKLYPNGAKS